MNVLTKLNEKVTRVAAAKRAHVELIRRRAGDAAAAMRDPANLISRRCPVCDDTRVSDVALRGVYDFHRCAGCSLLYAPRVLSRAADRRLASRDYWSFMYQDAKDMRGKAVYGDLVQRLAAAAPARRLAVDVGCHFGKLTGELGGVFERAIGLELDGKTAKVARQLFDADVRTARLEQLDVPPGSVDCIVMNQILEHLVDPRPLFAAAHRLLAPRGVLYVSIPHGGSVGLRVHGAAHRAVATHQHVNMFEEAPLRRLAADTGFTAVEVRTDDQLDVSAAEALARRVDVPLLLAPGFAIDLVTRRVAALTRLPSRLGVGAQLEGLFRKDP